MSMRGLVFIGLTVVLILSRLVDHPPNFTAVLAVALFSAAHFRNRFASVLAPLAAMMLSDVAIEVASRLHLFDGWLAHGRGFYGGMWVVYLSVAAVWALGLVLRSRTSVGAIAGTSFAGSLLFYLVTNFAWWAGYDEYPHTLAGLVQSYVAGLPFFGWTLAGTAYYAAILFGGFALARHRYPALRPAEQF